MADDSTEWFRKCAYCGSPLQVAISHPVYTERDENGVLHLHSFCDESCMEHWQAARDH